MAALAAVTLIALVNVVAAQSPGPAKEFWPELNANIDVLPRARLQLYVLKESGEDLARTQWKFGAMASYRMKRLVTVRHEEIDDEKNYYLSFGVGYEYLYTNDDGSVKDENRLFVQVTPQYYAPKFKVAVQDRNRIEFRWVNGTYSTRYRNRLTVQRPFKIDQFRFTPYAAGELFYDGQHRSWNENQYGFGVVIPFRKIFSVDTFVRRQNCTTCKEQHVNVLGVTLNFYLGKKKKK